MLEKKGLHAENTDHDKKGEDWVLEAASLTVSVPQTEDVDVAQKEHEARTGYEIIGKKGEPSIIDPIGTQEKLFCHEKVRNYII